MHGYHPRGISFKRLQEEMTAGKKFYVLSYFTDLVVDSPEIRNVEFIDKDLAIAAYIKIKEEGGDREYSLKEFEFKGNTWAEHIKNSMFDEGVHVVEAYRDTPVFESRSAADSLEEPHEFTLPKMG